MRALIVDGSPEDRHTLEMYLREGGHEAMSVATAGQAREALEINCFDLLLLDLPNGNGLVFCHEVRERLELGILIVFVSANLPRASRITALQVGADLVLDKPCDGEELRLRIDALRRRMVDTAGRD